MDSITILQVSENVIRKSAEMMVKDPHGFIITIVSVAVVFLALVLLYFAYSLIGKITDGKSDFKNIFRKAGRRSRSGCRPTEEEAAAIAMALHQEMNGELYAAIGMALHQHFNDTVHDTESYIITIRRK